MPFLDKPNAIINNIIKSDDNNEDWWKLSLWTTGQFYPTKFYILFTFDEGRPIKVMLGDVVDTFL